MTISSRTHLQLSSLNSSCPFFFFLLFFTSSLPFLLQSISRAPSIISLCFFVPNKQFNNLANALAKYKGDVCLIAILNRCLADFTNKTRYKATFTCKCSLRRGLRRTYPKYRQFTPYLWNTEMTPLLSERYLWSVMPRPRMTSGMHYFFRKFDMDCRSYYCLGVWEVLTIQAPVQRFTLINTLLNCLLYLLSLYCAMSQGLSTQQQFLTSRQLQSLGESLIKSSIYFLLSLPSMPLISQLPAILFLSFLPSRNSTLPSKPNLLQTCTISDSKSLLVAIVFPSSMDPYCEHCSCSAERIPGIMHWAITRWPRYYINTMCRTCSYGIYNDIRVLRLRRSVFMAVTEGVASRPFYWEKSKGVYWAIEQKIELLMQMCCSLSSRGLRGVSRPYTNALAPCTAAATNQLYTLIIVLALLSLQICVVAGRVACDCSISFQSLIGLLSILVSSTSRKAFHLCSMGGFICNHILLLLQLEVMTILSTSVRTTCSAFSWKMLLNCGDSLFNRSSRLLKHQGYCGLGLESKCCRVEQFTQNPRMPAVKWNSSPQRVFRCRQARSPQRRRGAVGGLYPEKLRKPRGYLGFISRPRLRKQLRKSGLRCVSTSSLRRGSGSESL